MGAVYFLTLEEDRSKVKIGFTSGDVKERVCNLQTGCPFKLIYLGYALSGGELEKALHRLCSEHRISGEWFAIEGVVKDVMEKLMTPIPTIVPKSLNAESSSPQSVDPKVFCERRPVGRPKKPVKDQPWVAAGKSKTAYYRDRQKGREGHGK